MAVTRQEGDAVVCHVLTGASMFPRCGSATCTVQAWLWPLCGVHNMCMAIFRLNRAVQVDAA